MLCHMYVGAEKPANCQWWQPKWDMAM